MNAPESNVFDCALVFEGGGYRVSYTCAFANVLLEQGIYFDYVCGLSAGASTTVNYLSRDTKRVREAFMTDGVAKGLVGLPSLLRGNGYFDADALYEGALRDGTLEFDWNSFAANPARLRIQAFERDSGRTVRFGREDMADAMRMIDLVRASSTLPGMMKPLEVDGRVLLDGGLGVGAGIPVCMAEDDGFDRFVFVATRPRGYRKKEPGARDRQMYKALAKDYPYLRNALLTRWERYNAAIDHVEELAEKGQALIIYPDEMPVKNNTVNPRRLAAAYDAGHAQYVREMPRVREFLFGAPDAGPRPEDPDQGTGYVTLG